MRCFILITLLCFTGACVAPAALALPDTPSDLAIHPDTLKVNTFFSGGQVTVTGEIPAYDDVMVEIIGARVNSLFDVKGRFGPFWMTRKKVDLENAPGLYILMLPAGPDWLREAAALNLGIEPLRQQIKIDREAPSDDFFEMFVKLKTSEELYGEIPGAVSYKPGENGRRRFTATCRLPSSVTMGTYTVKVTTVAKGVRKAQVSRKLTVQQEGLVKMMNHLAFHRGLLYGVAAVLIALAAGALMGLIFKGGGGH